MNEVLSIKNFYKSYLSKLILKDINFDLHKGFIYGLIGPNGSGKSTLMKAIYNLVKGSGDINAYGSRGFHIRNHVSYMPTSDYLYPNMTLKEIIKHNLDLYRDFNIVVARDLLYKLELDESDRVSSLSSGMLARFKLLLALSRDCPIYLLDEPLSGIDIISKTKVIDVIVGFLDNEKTLVISSHMLGDIESFLDRVIFLKEGEIVIDDSLEDIRSKHGKSLEDLYWEVFGGNK